jgi:UDP-N-acetylmuramoyl-L-alanyl-D-glutamate--2,6-diaminopimelate ligase
VAFAVETPAGRLHLRSPLVGRPNVYNLLAAVATGVAFEMAPDVIEQALGGVASVPGRFQVASEPGDDVTVVVDYAHTDDALKNLLETARPLASRQLITVFGCGGDRDRTKRPLMGAVAARLSDVVVVTSDNPRSEDPAAIIEDIKRGIVPPGDRSRPADAGRNGPRLAPLPVPLLMVLVDRRAAIERAVERARPGDLVIIAGKGHEKYQVTGDKVLPFDDVEVVRGALARRRRSAPRGSAA